MFKTKNSLSEEIRGKAVELLNARLAECIAGYAPHYRRDKLSGWRVAAETGRVPAEKRC